MKYTIDTNYDDYIMPHTSTAIPVRNVAFTTPQARFKTSFVKSLGLVYNNCPNCGANLTSNNCSYCGSKF